MKETDNVKKIFSNNLIYWTRIKLKKQSDIVRDLKISYSTVNDWYKGKNFPRIEALQKLANYFGIKISDLIEKNIDLENIEDIIKIGEYVRFRNGIIDKVIHIEKDTNKMWFENTYGRKTTISIVKHSPNLIDLIQCGDYVNGIKIISIIQQADTMKTISLCGFDNDYLDIKLNNRDIKTVVTKEMMESISYKVTKM